MTETPEIRLKRLKMRSMRRGIKEMDMILGTFAQSGLSGLSAGEIDIYESLLVENDHDLYAWFSGRLSAPAAFAPLIEKISGSLAREIPVAAQSKFPASV